MIDRLIAKIIEKENPIVAGLDPKLDYLPKNLLEKHFNQGASLEAAAEAILEFNIKILDSIHDLIPAVKLQIAYYELYGLPGLNTFAETIKYAKEKGLIVIGDVKRNDIGSTAEAYSAAYIGYTPLERKMVQAFPVDMITVNPYLGSDGIIPFIKDCKRYKKGIFVLVKTSNPSSGELQDLMTIDGLRLYQKVSEKVSDWGKELVGSYGYSNVCAVVGATYPEQLSELRQIMPNTFFLVPGYGAQGATTKDIMGGFDKRGLGCLINASRSIMCAYRDKAWQDMFSPEEFPLASRAEVKRMREEIHQSFMDKKGV